MAYRDLREWLERVKGMGELRQIDGADVVLEVGTLAEMANRETVARPALLFDHLKRFAAGHRILTGMLNSPKRLALTTEMPLDLDELNFLQAWRKKTKAMRPIPPRVLKDGPILEHVAVGREIDLHAFPAPKWHPLDGGHYLGTACVTISQDPQEGWVNLGTYRVMVHDRDTLGYHISPGQHGRIHRQKWFEAGKPFPIAISFGHDPLLFLVAASPVPYGLSEYDYAGAIRGQPIEVIQGKITGLPIPAAAELVIEGETLPGEERLEGPFGEFTGYYASSARPAPTIKVRSLMWRSDPIICGSPPTQPPSETAFFRSRMKSAAIWTALEEAGVPDVRGVWTPEITPVPSFIVVAIKQRYLGHARQAGLVACQCQAGASLGRYVVVVDEDIDPTNIQEVLWAIATRSDPARSIEILRRCWSGPLDPAIAKAEKGFNSRALIDACRPYEWIDEFPPVVRSDPEVYRKMKERWAAVLGS